MCVSYMGLVVITGRNLADAKIFVNQSRFQLVMRNGIDFRTVVSQNSLTALETARSVLTDLVLSGHPAVTSRFVAALIRQLEVYIQSNFKRIPEAVMRDIPSTL